MARKVGRPPIHPDRRRTVRVVVLLTPTEKAALDAQAERAGVSPGHVLRSAIRKTAGG